MDEIKFFRPSHEYGWLSNFHPCFFYAGGFRWETVEHFFQAMKSLDPAEREWVRKANTPGQAKQRGRKVKLREDWEEKKEEVMLFALRKKFDFAPLKAQLMATAPAMLIEDSPWDSYWGSGKDGKGKNRLGELLMQVRTELKEKANARIQ